MWKILILASFLLSGCGGPGDAIEACEAYVKATLRSPSTYERIKADQFLAVNGKEGWASVEYDAANAYGTPVRDKQVCRFKTDGGKWPALAEMVSRAESAAIVHGGTCCDDEEPSAARAADDLLDNALDMSAEEALRAADAALDNTEEAAAER